MMSFLLIPVLVFLVVFFACLIGTGHVIRFLNHRSILDQPNERSSHLMPTPRGGGIAVIGVIFPALIIIGLVETQYMQEYHVIAGLALGLALLSWIDDLRNLSPALRFLAQFIAVSIALMIMPPLELLPFLPWFLEILFFTLLWVWFVNLFNFMDGIDGITAVETITIGLGVSLISFATNLSDSLLWSGLTIAAAAAGFMRWNWHPAKVFLGDVGSIPLGFLIGWLLLTLAREGYPVPALILPLYYLTDATWTLCRRALRREQVWRAHKEHFYQKAVQQGLSHNKVSTIILIGNIFLVIFAYLAIFMPLLALICAFCTVGLLLLRLRHADTPQ